MEELRVIATIVAKAEFVSDLRVVFDKVVEETRKEAGNISYELHQSLDKPMKFIFFEVWQSQEALNAHNNSAHFKEFAQGIDGKIESLDIDVIKKI